MCGKYRFIFRDGIYDIQMGPSFAVICLLDLNLSKRIFAHSIFGELTSLLLLCQGKFFQI